MGFQFTCPRCGVATRFRLDEIGQKRSCPSCKNEITIEAESARPARQPRYQDPNFDLKPTRDGGTVGCCMACVFTIAFVALPMAVPLYASAAALLATQGREPLSRQVLFYVGVHLGLSCVY